MQRVARLASSLLLPALCLLPRAASAQFDNRAWTTYLHAQTCRDLIALRDTVWVATGEAGLLRYSRATDSWSSITREPNGLAGNILQAITFDRSGNLFVSVIGKGVSRLDRDGRWSLINEFDGLPSDTALVMRAQGDTVWIGTTRGLALWNGSVLAGSIPDRGTPSPFGSDRINGIAFTGDTMFVATPVGVYRALKSQLSSRSDTVWKQINAGLPALDPNATSLATDGHNVTVAATGRNINGSPVQTSFTWNPALASWFAEFPPGNPQVRRVRDDFGAILCTTVFTPSINGGVWKRRFSGGWDLLPGSPSTDNPDALGLEVGMDPDGVVFAFSPTAFSLSAPGALKAAPDPQGEADWTPHVPTGPVGNQTFNIFWANGSTYACYDGEGVARLRNGVWRNWRASDICVGTCDTTFTNAAFPTGALVDPLGYKWIGVWSGPLTRFDDEVEPPGFRNIVYQSAADDTVALHSFVWSSAADTNSGARAGRWFGLDTNNRGVLSPIGIDVYDTAGTLKGSFQPGYPNLRNGQVRALAHDPRANLMWVGYAQNSNAGLSTFPVPAAPGDSIHLSDVADTKLIDSFGIQIHGDSVWVLATDGLYRYDRTTRREITRLDLAGPPAPKGAVHPLAVAPDGSVFVGTSGGVRWYRRGFTTLDFTPSNSPIADIEVRAVFVEPSGVLWVGTASGINRFDPNFKPPPVPVLPSLHVTVYPNPSWRTRAGFELKLRGQATHYDGEIYDINGRLVHRFAIDGNDRQFWNGFDMNGRGVGAGVYFLRVRGGGAEATARIVVLR
jgi:hypothetical protein